MEWKEPYTEEQIFEITSGRDTLMLDKRYHPGQGDLTVYYNGFLAVKGKDYEETSPWSIKFLFMLNPGDKVVCKIQKFW
jgi:hypothetical protein